MIQTALGGSSHRSLILIRVTVLAKRALQQLKSGLPPPLPPAGLGHSWDNWNPSTSIPV